MPAEGEMRAPTTELPVIAAEILDRLRAGHPRVHCITNAVAQNLTANTLLAVGAIPSMTTSPEEIGGFMQLADALLVNLGTFDAGRREATEIAIAAAGDMKLPWVLDPVLIDRSPTRAADAKKLIKRAPKALRLNRNEFAVLAGSAADDFNIAAHANELGAVIGLTGAIDIVADGSRLSKIANGDPLMAKVTALGCAESALVAACLAVESDAWRATAAALLIMGVAGEVAAKRARGPGSFAVEILDALYALDRNTLFALAKVT
jgi:hydroxyethylthiazole kinase